MKEFNIRADIKEALKILIDGFDFYKRKEKIMANELTITKDKVLEAAKVCPDSREVLETLFPEVFETDSINLQEGHCYIENTRNEEYVLLEHYSPRNEKSMWKLYSTKIDGTHWDGWKTADEMKRLIANDLTRKIIRD